MSRVPPPFFPRLSPLRMVVAACFLLAGVNLASAQARREVAYNYSPDQLTILYQRTLDDYSLLEPNGAQSRVTLNGATVEYAWTRFYPLEIVGRASYATGQPLGQHLMSFTGGAGYTHQVFSRYFPFARATAGIAHTSSSDQQYLYNPGKSGFAIDVAGGLDINLTERWGIRVIEVQNQYLPFGIGNEGSVYWSLGSGVTYHFGK